MSPAPIFASKFQTHKSGWLTDFEYYLKSEHLTIEILVSMEYPRTLIIPVYPYIHSPAHTNFKDLKNNVFC